ncbi:MAG: hypothetical protein KJN90_14325, partial [Gammaproteobacteria bacterium]|nr:hypothetical protein [Gammaproteobacteria bacterium]
LLLHGMVLAMSLWIMEQRAHNRQMPAPTTVRINLLSPVQQPQRQLRRSEPAEQTEGSQQVPRDIAEQAISETVERPSASDLRPAPLVELPQLAESPVAPQQGEADSRSVTTPDTLTLRQTVRAIGERQRSAQALSSCTLAQRRNELFDCRDNEQPDYAESLRVPIYLSFNLPQPDDQSRRAMGTIDGNQQQLRAGIQAASLDGVNNEYLLEELSQGIEVYSGTGNTRLERLTEQILRTDPVHQQAERIMNPR